jgi:hypothetical protein
MLLHARFSTAKLRSSFACESCRRPAMMSTEDLPVTQHSLNEGQDTNMFHHPEWRTEAGKVYIPMVTSRSYGSRIAMPVASVPFATREHSSGMMLSLIAVRVPAATVANSSEPAICSHLHPQKHHHQNCKPDLSCMVVKPCCANRGRCVLDMMLIACLLLGQ